MGLSSALTRKVQNLQRLLRRNQLSNMEIDRCNSHKHQHAFLVFIDLHNNVYRSILAQVHKRKSDFLVTKQETIKSQNNKLRITFSTGLFKFTLYIGKSRHVQIHIFDFSLLNIHTCTRMRKDSICEISAEKYISFKISNSIFHYV